ncbi:hypothetical protein NPIL_254851 [Nephila pilipes]|uniref:Uncharacterized protein n=1 Tax=Nephila pilipes TaxID=299642 RepID=A0A8X6PHY3_NEPPI|nr:hypothetical protein NPIL_254851 [Nephila pilipes]
MLLDNKARIGLLSIYPHHLRDVSHLTLKEKVIILRKHHSTSPHVAVSFDHFRKRRQNLCVKSKAHEERWRLRFVSWMRLIMMFQPTPDSEIARIKDRNNNPLEILGGW